MKANHAQFNEVHPPSEMQFIMKMLLHFPSYASVLLIGVGLWNTYILKFFFFLWDHDFFVF